MEITLDAHTILWFINKDHGKLPRKTFDLITETEKNGKIFIPIIALCEIMHMIEKYNMKLNLNELIKDFDHNIQYQIVPLTTDILVEAIKHDQLEMHDRLILATSIITDSILITKDSEIIKNADNTSWN